MCPSYVPVWVMSHGYSWSFGVNQISVFVSFFSWLSKQKQQQPLSIISTRQLMGQLSGSACWVVGLGWCYLSREHHLFSFMAIWKDEGDGPCNQIRYKPATWSRAEHRSPWWHAWEPTSPVLRITRKRSLLGRIWTGHLGLLYFVVQCAYPPTHFLDNTRGEWERRVWEP